MPEAADYCSEHLAELEASRLFDAAERRTYLTEETYTRQQYINLLSTFSDNLILEEAIREKLFECIGSPIDDNFNGQIRLTYCARLNRRAKQVS